MRILTALASIVLSLFLAEAVCAQAYPSKRITLVVPFPPGGATDSIARIVGNQFTARLGQPVIIENKPGAGSFIGAEYVRTQPADGYTLLMVGSQLSVPRSMVAVESFVQSDIAPLGRVAAAPVVLAVPPQVPARSLSELIAYVKANPGKLNYGTIPNSTFALDLVRLVRALGASMQEVPYTGGAALSTALMTNEIQLTLLGASVIPNVEAGKLFAIAVTSRKRWSRVPQWPTTIEQGLDYEAGYWYGLGIRAVSPAAAVSALARELAEAAKLPELQETVRKIGMDPVEPSPAEMAEAVRKELEQNNAAMKAIGVK
jgi:tripartite-type tricarboxylate transporter receptor subunit TctC